MTFDKDGNLIAGFDVINFIFSENQTIVKIGKIDPHSSPDKMLIIKKDTITWNSWFNQVGPRN